MVAILDINMPVKKDGKTEVVKVTRVLGEMQTVSYSIHMDKSPVRSIGSVNAKDYVFGPRTIAGSLVFAMFNRHIAHEILLKANESASGGQTGQMIVMDELPPFNVTISMANEYGKTARLAIYGIRIINEGNVMSVNDVYTENTYQFVATDIEYLSDGDGSSSSGHSKASDYYDEKRIAIASLEGAKPVPVEAGVPNEQAPEEDGDGEPDVKVGEEGLLINFPDEWETGGVGGPDIHYPGAGKPVPKDF